MTTFDQFGRPRCTDCDGVARGQLPFEMSTVRCAGCRGGGDE